MSRFSRTLLAASISAAFFVPQTQAEATLNDSVQELPAIDQCLINEPEPENPNQQPVKVEADSLEAINGNKATYKGDVVVVQGKKRFQADQVTLHEKENIIVAEGNVAFSDGTVKSQSDKVTNNLTTEDITLENTKYKFLCEPGRGDAVYIAKTGKAVYEMKDGSITSCPEGDNAWRMRASGIDVDQNEEVATFYNPRFEVMDVPVFYVPYLTVPIGDTRKTGFLYPTASYGSSDGLELEIPFYWNIAPNYDLETEIKYMQQRGTQLNNKFRYLSIFGEGEIEAEYLPNDRKFTEKGDRWGFQYTHEGIYQQAWKFNIDYSQVSDVDYFTDVDSSIGNREDGQLVQEGKVQYRSTNWDATLLTRDFQVLTESDNLPYHILPQVKFNYYSPELLRYLDFDVISHVTRFDTEADGKPAATRVHVEPGFTVPLGTTWGTWTTEARLLGTYYQQDLTGVSDSELEERVTRVMPEVRSLAGVVLERDTIVLDNYTQTLEPQVQYLYIPEVEQNNIANYDTTLLQTDYYGLFRSRKYSGVDKIQGANQFSYGASSRFYDSDYKERLSVSFGQIIYLDRTNRLDSSSDEPSNYSAWAVEMDFNYGDYLFYHGGVQYDVDASEIQVGNSTLEYRFDKGYLQGNYRYVTRSYIENTLGDSLGDLDSITEDGISQGGLLGSYKLSRHWDASAQYFYDFTTEQTIEWLGRINYTSDCWYVGVSYSNQLRNWDPDFNSYPDSEPEYENNFSVNFGIIGFGTNLGGGSGSSDNSLGYGRPFFLNN
ncbi:LPS assembly outer membrane complex protein LptD [Vibrio sinaloensis DSM 21326]|uniref:LPS-assembly protein LptD n=1 Tax=Vibrio sinaloensis DSM 21326 TaxID=945550 RepID=E8M1X7_PHOS4|nr:LPS assembly protein LptD [Vibrio sinaloensis]EGA71991.1 LPS assembly outer membrane complex protein LptD [Vibrio sinaloensis DSM 21326]